MTTAPASRRIPWYRVPVERDILAALNRRSDARGLLQSLSHLGLLALTGAATWLAFGRLPLVVFLLLLLIHGTFWAFLLNGFHELCHKTVFKTKALNTTFLYVVSFLGWYNPVLFWASHQEHHKYTLHPPADQEVLFPVKLTLNDFLKDAVVNPWGFVARLKEYIRLSIGRIDGEWENTLFPESDVKLRRSLFNWARLHLLGQALIVIIALATGLWPVILLVTLAPFYGGWLLFLCNNTQHVGLQDNVPDFRLCCRTITLNPFVQFLYWHMNFHTEHHMYAAVPCYNLARLHEEIKDEMPYCPRGLVATWKQIIPILERQKVDPTYQYIAELPARA